MKSLRLCVSALKIFIQPLVNRRLMMNSSENTRLFHAKAQRRKVKNRNLVSLAPLREIFIQPLVNPG